MSASASIESMPLRFREEGANFRAELFEDAQAEKVVSSLWIIPFHMRIGQAVVRMDGIGGVGTPEEYRNRGYSRRVIEGTLAHMRDERGAALAMLYGIRHFYPKFGFATAGPDHLLTLPAVKAGETVPLPEGWQVRPGKAEDLPAIQQLYAAYTANAVGTSVREEGAGVWSRLAQNVEERGGEELRLVLNPAGEPRGYLWRCPDHWYPRQLAQQYSDALMLGEAVAADAAAADAVLAAGRAWAGEPQPDREQPLTKVLLALTPDSPIATAATYQDSQLIQKWDLCGGVMVAVLDTERLLRSMEPELRRRFWASKAPWTGVLALRTEAGDALLECRSDFVRVVQGDLTPDLDIPLPATALGRLALGVFPPEDLLARLPTPVTGRAAAALSMLFPQRRPHLNLPDRY